MSNTKAKCQTRHLKGHSKSWNLMNGKKWMVLLSLCVHFSRYKKDHPVWPLTARYKYQFFHLIHFEDFDCNECYDRLSTRAPKENWEKCVVLQHLCESYQTRNILEINFKFTTDWKIIKFSRFAIDTISWYFPSLTVCWRQYWMQFILCFRCNAQRHFYSVPSNENHTHSFVS